MKRNLVKGCLWQRGKDIPNYEGYYRCSSLGNVKSLNRTIIRSDLRISNIKEKILKPALTKKGYLVVVLCVNSKNVSLQIQQLVAITFLGHISCGNKVIVDHKNGNKVKNYVSNLQTVTSRENNTVCFRKNNGKYSSQYVGVSWNNGLNKWMSQIYVNGKHKYLGLFDSELEASESYQKALEHVKIGCPESYLESISHKSSSTYVGVSWYRKLNKWRSAIRIDGKKKHLGYFYSESEASSKYQNELLKLNQLKLNQ